MMVIHLVVELKGDSIFDDDSASVTREHNGYGKKQDQS